MTPLKEKLLARSMDELIELATHLAVADNDLRWALVEARREAGMSQRELAEAMGVKQATISRIESPDNDPRLSTLRRYALAVGATIDHRVETSSRVIETDGWEPVSIELSAAVNLRPLGDTQVTIAPATRAHFAPAA